VKNDIAARQSREEDEWQALKLLLMFGKEREGIRLTRAECQILWEILSGKRKRSTRRGRPLDPEAEKKARMVAWYTLLLEEDGTLPKNAIAAARQLYGVSRAFVFAARSEWCPKDVAWIRQMDPRMRRFLIEGLV
jgi:hypothetical protein